MEGTKYAQHNQSNNITCIILLSHIDQNYATLEYLIMHFVKDNQRLRFAKS
jgi:hypothetical protein